MKSRAMGAAIAGLGVLVLLSSGGGKSQASTTPKPKPKPIPEPGTGPIGDAILQRIAQALATGDPAKMRAEAAKLRREGYTKQADDLDRAALIAQAALDALPDPRTAEQPTDPWGANQLPPLPGPVPPIPTAKPIPAGSRVLRLGMAGADVLGWQYSLEKDKFRVDKDGKFGPATEAATKEWQTDHGVKPDGIVGPATLAKVGSKPLLGARTLRLGSQGSAVVAWQSVLGKDGYPVASIGDFEATTDVATEAWQSAHGLKPDGIVGPSTIKKIGTAPIARAPLPLPPVSSQPAQPSALPTALPLPSVVPILTSGIPALKSVDPDKWRTMRRGTAGADVAEWQMVLNRDGYPVAMDGKFGPATEAATKAWQTKRHLTSDGIVGPNTRAAISARPEQSATVSGDLDPAPAHTWMSAPAHFLSVSPLPGILPKQVPTEIVPEDRALAARVMLHLFEHGRGKEDRALVQEFQRANGLNPTGAYGPSTALAFVSYGIVPTKPFYWPSKGLLRAKAGYRLTLMHQARNDEQRSDEWAAAANV
jgi:peptidoglycan hydrolase-like protein with peptidoglycan-binding domain